MHPIIIILATWGLLLVAVTLSRKGLIGHYFCIFLLYPSVSIDRDQKEQCKVCVPLPRIELESSNLYREGQMK